MTRGKHSYVLQLGLVPYAEAHELQLELVGARKERLERDVYLCLEHPPVFTLGRRGGLNNLKVAEDFLNAQGIQVVHAERGGDITYHGPGQAVVYPIVDLAGARLGVADYVTALEEVMIWTAADWGIHAERNALNRGVWLGLQKLGSIGIAVRRGVSFHGIALNVNTRLEHFRWIDPCGLQGVSMTSMSQILGKPVLTDEVFRALLSHVEHIFGTGLAPLTLEQLKGMLAGPSQVLQRCPAE